MAWYNKGFNDGVEVSWNGIPLGVTTVKTDLEVVFVDDNGVEHLTKVTNFGPRISKAEETI